MPSKEEMLSIGINEKFVADNFEDYVYWTSSITSRVYEYSYGRVGLPFVYFSQGRVDTWFPEGSSASVRCVKR